MNNYLKLGIFAGVGIIAIVASIMAVGTFTFSKGYIVYVKFNNISGLTKKAKVKIAGVDIGVLRGVSLEGSKAKLRLLIDKKVILYENASAKIVSMGVVGTKYIEIIPGDASFPVLKADGCISSVHKLSVEDMLVDVADRMSKILSDERGGDIIENLLATISLFKKVLDSFASQNSQIVSLISNVNKFSGDLTDISTQNRQNLTDAILSIKNISAEMAVLISRIYNGEGPLSVLINDKNMSDKIKETLTSLKQALDSINSKFKMVDNFQIKGNVAKSLRNDKAEFDAGVRAMWLNRYFAYFGILSYKMNKEYKIIPEILIGTKFFKEAEIYLGFMKSRPGMGLRYSFFCPVWNFHKALRIYLNMYEFKDVEGGGEIELTNCFGLGFNLATNNSMGNRGGSTSTLTLNPYLKIGYFGF